MVALETSLQRISEISDKTKTIQTKSYMLQSDSWIQTQSEEQTMITPFVDHQIKKISFDINEDTLGNPDNSLKESPVLSYGLSSFGYDIRLSAKDFYIFKRIPGAIIDPKKFNKDTLQKAQLHQDATGSYFIIPANSYALGVSLERFTMPDYALGIILGKSTLARCGIILNGTPLEPSWEGYLTLEFSNSSTADCKIYANEGCGQVLFFTGSTPSVSYRDRGGKYQNQSEKVTTSRMFSLDANYA